MALSSRTFSDDPFELVRFRFDVSVALRPSSELTTAVLLLLEPPSLQSTPTSNANALTLLES